MMGTCAGVAVLLCGVIVVLSLALPTSAAVTNPGCGADLSNKVKKFQTANLPCKNYGFPVSNPYVIWAVRDNVTQVATMVVSMPLSPSKWAGIGFSRDGHMPNSTALIVTLSSSGAPIMKVYSLEDKSESGVVVDATKLTFVGGPPEGHYDQGRTVYVSFKVDFAKSSATPSWFLMAYGNLYVDGTLNQHEARNFFTAEFASGFVDGGADASYLQRKANLHGSLQILGWGLLLPFGALLARYMRDFDLPWFYPHVTVQILGFAVIVLGAITGVDLSKDLRPDHFQVHRAIGLFISSLAILQVLALVLRPKKDAKIRKYWNWYHSGMGRLALFLAVINIVLGLYIGKADKKLKIAYVVFLVLELVAFILLETLLWLRKKRQARVQHSSDPNVPAFQFGGSI